MSHHTRKGYRAVQARNPKTGQVYSAAVAVGSGLDRRIERERRKAEKAVREHRREFKAAQREAKKVVPLGARAYINWSGIKREVKT